MAIIRIRCLGNILSPPFKLCKEKTKKTFYRPSSNFVRKGLRGWNLSRRTACICVTHFHEEEQSICFISYHISFVLLGQKSLLGFCFGVLLEVYIVFLSFDRKIRYKWEGNFILHFIFYTVNLQHSKITICILVWGPHEKVPES